MKEDGPSTARTGGETTATPSAATTPKVANAELPDTDAEGSGSETAAAPSTTAPSTAATPAPAEEKAPADANLVGRINNLISTDLENITESRDFMFLLIYAPLQICLCVWFLYTFLQWAALVGMGVTVLGLYIPGKVATITHGVQVKRMKAVSFPYHAYTRRLAYRIGLPDG